MFGGFLGRQAAEPVCCFSERASVNLMLVTEILTCRDSLSFI